MSKYSSSGRFTYTGGNTRINKSYDKNHVQPSVFENGGKEVTIGGKTYNTASKEYRKLIESGKVKPYTTDTESGIGAFDYGNLPDLEITAPETSSYGLHAPIDETSDWTDGRTSDGIDPEIQKRVDEYQTSLPHIVKDINKVWQNLLEYLQLCVSLTILHKSVKML